MKLRVGIRHKEGAKEWTAIYVMLYFLNKFSGLTVFEEFLAISISHCYFI